MDRFSEAEQHFVCVPSDRFLSVDFLHISVYVASIITKYSKKKCYSSVSLFLTRFGLCSSRHAPFHNEGWKNFIDEGNANTVNPFPAKVYVISHREKCIWKSIAKACWSASSSNLQIYGTLLFVRRLNPSCTYFSKKNYVQVKWWCTLGLSLQSICGFYGAFCSGPSSLMEFEMALYFSKGRCWWTNYRTNSVKWALRFEWRDVCCKSFAKMPELMVLYE